MPLTLKFDKLLQIFVDLAKEKIKYRPDVTDENADPRQGTGVMPKTPHYHTKYMILQAFNTFERKKAIL